MSDKTLRPRIPLVAGGLLLLSVPAPAQLTDLGNLLLDECSASLETCEANDRFGSSVAAGDFNGDGFVDLAVGVPGEVVSGVASAGSIHVFYGGARGLALNGDQVLTKDTAGVSGAPETNGRWGSVLASGYLDADGFADLAVGAPDEDIQIGGTLHPDAGAVWVLFGSASGLSGSDSVFYQQENLPCCNTESVEDFDRFGAALTVIPRGTSVSDGLAIGAPGEDGVFADEGLVVTLKPLAGVPLAAVGFLRQSAFFSACGEVGELGDRFGASLAAGAFGGVGDLAVGAPGETIDLKSAAGLVAVDHNGDPDRCFHQDTPGIAETTESNDEFGAALSRGDFDGDGFDDLAIGVPGEESGFNASFGAGAVQILYGAEVGLSSNRDQIFDQGDFSPEQVPGFDDRFGTTLASGDFDGDGVADLAIGTPDEGLVVGGVNRVDAGVAHVLYGVSGTGLSSIGRQTFHQDLPAGMLGVPASNDRFGDALAAGDFDGNGVDDLAVGVPGDNPGASSGGRVQVLYGLDRETGAFGTVSFASGAVSFPEDQATRVIFVVRAGGAPVSASVTRRLAGGTATAGVDFSYADGTETWGIGDLTPEFFGIVIRDDEVPEADETIVLELADPSAGTALGTPDRLTITIVDDDAANCRLLSRTHTGVGSDPLAGPLQSPGCPFGRYAAGQVVDLLAAPANGWIVVGWSGTKNDASAATTNVASIPDRDSAVSVAYFPFDLLVSAESFAVPAVVEACHTITTSGVVQIGAGADVTFRAPSRLSFGSGFRVSGAFRARVEKPAVCP